MANDVAELARNEAFVAAGGEMGARIRAHDWSSTLGPLHSWPQSLKTCVRIILTSRQPMFVWWGESLINLYNDAYKAIVGGKHPEALGQPAAQVWSEIWDDVYPRARAALQGDEGTYDEALLLIMERNGYQEETYYTFSYSPVPSDHGVPAGIICANTDDTQRIVGERRLALLRELATRGNQARTWLDACASSASALATNTRDLPFALIYIADSARRSFRLAGSSGIDPTHPAATPELAFGAPSIWPLSTALSTGALQLVDIKDTQDVQFATLPSGDWPRPPSQVALVPIAAPGQAAPAGVLIVGLNPYRPFDESYGSFLSLVAAQIAASIANAHAYEQEKQRAEALAEIDRAKTAFFSNVSHEFRTPLTLIVGPSEDALAETPAGLARDRWKLVHGNSLRLLKLVNTLLEFSRIEAGRTQASYVPTDLATLTAELASTFRAAIDRAGIRYRVDCAPLPEPVYIDQDMWEKIVLNLLSNALKFTFAGEIAVSVRHAPDAAVLTIRDSGTGIPEHELPNVFARFHRIQGARSRTHEGSGIGLALVHELVRLHGGTIEVASQQEVGTTFTVRMPYGSSHLPAGHVHTNRSHTPTSGGPAPFVEEALRWLPSGGEPHDSTTPEPAAPGVVAPASGVVAPALGMLAPALDATSAARIMLADDNADMREYVARLLRQHWTVETAANGQEALEAVRRNPPELLLTDVMMPELDGFQLLRALRENASTRTLPVIMLSARAGEESRVEGFSAGADDYMVKPFTARELIARVGTHLALARARSETRAAHARLRALFAQAPVAVSVVRGPELTFELTNARYERMVGRSGLVGKTMREAFPELPVDAPIYAMLEEVRITGAAFTANEYHVALDRSGGGKLEDVYFLLTSQPVREPDGTIDSIITVGVDVTQQVTMRREIEALSREREQLLTKEKQARSASESANRSKDEFLAMLGHELRNPLAPIRTALSLIRQRHPDVALSERTVIERQVEHLVRLVDDLLDIARITGGKVVLKKATLELSELVAKAIELASPLLEQRRHELSIEVQRSGLMVEVDPTRLTQVIANLLINAAKYTEPPGRIWVTARRDGSMIELHVRDSGLGIGPSMLPRVFDLFVQEAQASDRPQGGLGIGLAIVKSLVAMHGGSVAAQSEGLGRGSTFTIRLPAAVSDGADTAALAASVVAPGSPARPLRVLIVDDNVDAAEMLAEWVQLLGYEVRIAPDGPAALALVQEFHPDTALLDLGLPVMDGYELARRLRAQPGLAGVMLIAATGYGQESDRVRTAEAGFDLHFVKPLDLQLLTQALASSRN